ncbi:MAG: hypothetical protein JW744_02730, partial [Candidatus Diapherotrites archaeon]|nr:hypothetical protein [Candidatus Diapherotrites archaeon]
MQFAPSFATPVLMEMKPGQDGSVESYYYVTDATTGLAIPSPLQSYMNFWTGTGSTMGERPLACLDFGGSLLPYRWQDSKAASTSCAASRERESFGYSYLGANPEDALYFESIFFVPFNESYVLNPACRNSSQFYSPAESTLASGLVSLSRQSTARQISSVQNVIDLVGQELVCVTTDEESIKFWWNPQKVLSELEPVKEGINPGWDQDLACAVAPN